MALLRNALLAFALALPAALVVETPAAASVSIAIGFDALLKDADAVAVITPLDAQSVWEEGRIYTYTKVKVDQPVAGDLAAGAEAYVKTMGGIVGKIGQSVDGEPVFTTGKPAMLFLRKLAGGGVFEVSARGQGQYPVLLDEVKKTRKLMRSANAGLLLPPKPTTPAVQTQTQTQSTSKVAETPVAKVQIRLAADVIHDRPVDDAAREIATTWRRLHAPPAK